MNFQYSEEQNLARWAQDNYSFEQRRVTADSEHGFSKKHWATFAQLGWLSVPFAQEFGGYGGGVIDLAAVMQEFGKALVVEPVFPTLVLFGGLLQNSTNTDIKTQLIPQMVEGRLLGALALYEPQSRFDVSNVVTSATQSGELYHLNGTKSVVLGGAHADKLIVVARTSGGETDEHGLSLFLLDASSEGVEKKTYPLMDGQRVADIHFNNAQAQLISVLDEAYQPLMATLQTAHVAMAAEAIGIMEKLNRTTLEYTKTRQQFGVAISSFQALQHRMVDTFMAYEQCRSLLIGTLCELTDDVTGEQQASKIVHALRTLVAKNGKLIGDEAIQMHGGMGLTDELDVGHYVKRIMMINLLFGNADFFQDQFNQTAYR